MAHRLVDFSTKNKLKFAQLGWRLATLAVHISLRNGGGRAGL